MTFTSLVTLGQPAFLHRELVAKANEGEGNAEFYFNLGKCVAGLHEANILCDAHLENFVAASDAVILVDADSLEYFSAVQIDMNAPRIS